MNIFGLVTVHPLTFPVSNELFFSATQAVKLGMLMYSAVIVPELQELREILILLDK